MHSGCKTTETHRSCDYLSRSIGAAMTDCHRLGGSKQLKPISATERLRRQQTRGLARASSGLAEGLLLTTSSRSRRDWGALWLFCLFYCFNKGTNSKARVFIPLQWGLGFQPRNLGRHKHSVYNSLHRKHQRPEKKLPEQVNEFNRSKDRGQHENSNEF